jgi:predicted MFS family arabinose efflux permease
MADGLGQKNPGRSASIWESMMSNYLNRLEADNARLRAENGRMLVTLAFGWTIAFITGLSLGIWLGRL